MSEYTLYINGKEYAEYVTFFEAENVLKKLRGNFDVAEFFLTYHVAGSNQKCKTEKRYQEYANTENQHDSNYGPPQMDHSQKGASQVVRPELQTSETIEAKKKSWFLRLIDAWKAKKT